MIDYDKLVRPDLPPAAVKWSGFPKYNFVGGHNDAAAVPVDALVESATRVLKREGRTLATYSLESGPQGYRPLREFLVQKLARDAGIQCTADDILITSGSLQGLDLVNNVLLQKGDTVILEETNYQGSINRVRKHGCSIVSVPVDRDGMDVAAVGRALDQLAARGVKPKYIYTIPTVHNPSGTVLSLARRKALIELATKHGVPIFEDDCYADLTWTGERPPALRGLAGDDRVIHIGSFSKSIAPALRLGFLVASWPLMGRILSVKTDAGTGAVEQMILADYCASHFHDHVVGLRKALRRKYDVLVEALGASFGTAAEFEPSEGGIFLWVKLPDSVDTMKLFQVAGKEGVAINPGAEWSVDPAYGRTRLRLCFANPTEQQIRDGVAKLAEICNREFGVPTRIANVGR